MLPALTSGSRAELVSLLPRRSPQPGLPGDARQRRPDLGGPERSLFIIDGPEVAPTGGPPLVVIAVNVVNRVEKDPNLSSAIDVSGMSRMSRLPIMSDPYAQFGQPDRGTLVDQYA